MSRRALPVVAAAGLLPLLLAAPALADSAVPVAHPAAVRTAPASAGVKGTISVTTPVRTAQAGKYGKFGVSFRCERGRHFLLFGDVSQEQGRGGEADNLDEPLEGVCTGHTQQRTVYVAAMPPIDPGAPVSTVPWRPPADTAGKIVPLRTGSGWASAGLATSRTRDGEPRLDAMTMSLVKVHPR